MNSFDFESFGVEVRGDVSRRYEAILNSKALSFLVALHTNFEAKRQELLEQRVVTEKKLSEGHEPCFLPHTKSIREGHWKVDPPKKHSTIRDRTVDIVCWRVFDEKFVSACVESGSNGIQFDYDDSWHNCLESQLQLFNYVSLKNAQRKSSGRPLPDMLVRPRSLNLDEGHLVIQGKALSGSLFDLGVWMTTWHAYSKKKDECYFYIPKIENHHEARWWDEVLSFTEDYFKLSKGCLKALVLIENILAAFEMEEILYELRHHCLGLNTGKWDYIFSYIKKFRHDPKFVLPDRALLTMDQTFMGAYEALLIRTCKKRGCVATGGMAPNLSKNVRADDKATYAKILEAKSRGATVGLNGELVADPIFVDAVKEAFYKKGKVSPAFKLATTESGVAKQLLSVPRGAITTEGVKLDVKVALNYIESWMRGEGGCPLDYAVEDLATAEISRWIKHGVKTEEGQLVSLDFVKELIHQLLTSIESQLGNSAFNKRHYTFAQQKLETLLDVNHFVDFMPTLLYPHLLAASNKAKL